MSQDWSGMLGQQWFAGKTWIFDYPHQKLSLIPHFPSKTGCAHRVALGFQDKDGERQANFPRIQVSVDGEVLDLLLDTGASTKLTEMAQRTVADGRPSNRATSFIVASVFDKWHQRHPDWRVIEEAEEQSGMSMIEVPTVSVAGHSIGPVWFTRRADKNFHEFMSQWMDRKVDGAIGGNALRFFRVTIDYPNAVALFERGGNL